MFFRTLALAGAAVGLCAPAAAVTITYTDFASTAGLQLNGNAAMANDGTRDVLRLTPATYSQSGSAFSTSAVTLGANYSFSTAFTFNINNSGNSGADGIVFAIQTVANTAGGVGGGIGYQGIGNSVGIEFDTFDNGGGYNDPNGNHVGVDAGGSVYSLATAIPSFSIEDDGDLTAFIDYDGTSDRLEVRLSQDGLRPAAALLSYTIDVAAQLGSPNAYVGFTAGTGAAFADHDIVNWQFRDNFSPISNPTQPPPATTSDVPEPASWATMVAGFGLLGGSLRGRRARRPTFPIG